MTVPAANHIYSAFIFNELRTASVALTQDKLGEILVREGLITQEQLLKALDRMGNFLATRKAA